MNYILITAIITFIVSLFVLFAIPSFRLAFIIMNISTLLLTIAIWSWSRKISLTVIFGTWLSGGYILFYIADTYEIDTGFPSIF